MNQSHLSDMPTFMFFPVIPSIESFLAILTRVRPDVNSRFIRSALFCVRCASDYQFWLVVLYSYAAIENDHTVRAFLPCGVGCEFSVYLPVWILFHILKMGNINIYSVIIVVVFVVVVANVVIVIQVQFWVINASCQVVYGYRYDFLHKTCIHVFVCFWHHRHLTN